MSLRRSDLKVASVAARAIDQVRDRLAIGQRLHVGRHQRRRAARVGQRRHMRQHGHLRMAPERMFAIGSGSLSNTSSTACPRRPLSSAAQQVGLDHVRAARQIDQRRAARQRREEPGIEQAARCRRERQQVDDDRTGRSGRATARRRRAHGARQRTSRARRRASSRHAVAVLPPARARTAQPICRARAPPPAVSSARRCGSWRHARAALLALRRRRSRGAATARPTARSRPSPRSARDRPCARSARRAATWDRSSSRSTPAHSDWIRRSRGRPARLSGGGLATIATSMRVRSNNSPAVDAGGRRLGSACAQQPLPLIAARQRRSCRPAAGSCSALARCAAASRAAHARTVARRTAARSPSKRRRSLSCAPRRAARRAKPNQTVPTGLPGVPPPGPGDAGDRHRQIGAAANAQRALGHRARHRFADRAVLLRSARPARRAARSWPRCSR